MSELTTDMSDLFTEFAKTSKEGKKLERQRAQIDEAKLILPTLDMTDSLDASKAKVKSMLEILYFNNQLVNQNSYLTKKRTVLDVVSQAYNIIASKEEFYEKNYADMLNRLEGE